MSMPAPIHEDNAESKSVVSAAPKTLSLPRLQEGQRLDLRRLCDPLENFYLVFILLANIAALAAVIGLAFYDLNLFAVVMAYALVTFFALWVAWKLLFVFILGNSIQVGPVQFPQIYRLVLGASEVLGIEAPVVLIMQGHGLFEALVAKRFSRRGFVILTSNMVDDLSERGSSRELMFFIGRQMGHMAAGHFRFWFFKSVIGRLAVFFHSAWERRCHFTADRIGLMVAGELYAAEQAMLIITAGCSVAPSTNIAAIKEQRAEVFESPWAWLRLAFSDYPYMIDRIIKLREFAQMAVAAGMQANMPIAMGALPIPHGRIRALPLMVIHGHSLEPRLELENFLFRKFPHVSPILMIGETDGAASLPEKFERLAGEVRGAVALLTPDDMAVTLRSGVDGSRARQNVVVEIGWFWGKFGRKRCLLLMKGNVEMPSDLSGVEVHRFQNSPVECSEVLRDFIESLG